MANLPFSCRCGNVKGLVKDLPKGNHAQCFCKSCRAAAIFVGDPDPGAEGITVWQTTPDKITITQGADQLSCFAFTGKRLLRWRAACCGAALFNTMPNPGFALAAVHSGCFDDPNALGPIATRGFIPQPGGGIKHEGILKLACGALARAFAARLTGRWKQTPFFDVRTRTPVVEVDVLPEGTRARLLNDAK